MQTRNIKQEVPHPQYDATSQANDLMLYELDVPVDYPAINVTCANHPNLEDKAATPCAALACSLSFVHQSTIARGSELAHALALKHLTDAPAHQSVLRRTIPILTDPQRRH